MPLVVGKRRGGIVIVGIVRLCVDLMDSDLLHVIDMGISRERLHDRIEVGVRINAHFVVTCEIRKARPGRARSRGRELALKREDSRVVDQGL